MELDLNGIITKIRTEGVGEAEKAANEILSKAKQESERIIRNAKTEKDEILKSASAESEKIIKNAEESVRQASRDVLLGLRQSIIALFDKVMRREVASVMTTDVLKNMLMKLAENFSKNNGTNQIEVLLNDSEKKALDNMLAGALKSEMKKGVVLKSSPNVEKGFLIGEKDGSAYYDFTDDAIVEAMKVYLNAKMASKLSTGA